MASCEDKTSGSVYKTLPDASKYIRLLHIEPGDDDAVISCKLEIAPLSDEPQYAALSYTWGDPQNTREILIDGRTVRVRYNCFYALSQLRGLQRFKSYWIDAICIHQDDLEEKARQVQMMSEIYVNAEEVFVSLGEHADDSAWLFEFLDDYPEYDPESDPDPEVIIQYFDQVARQQGCQPLSRARRAIENLERRPYWRRLWIVQEFLSAVKLSIMCGPSWIHWHILRDVLRTLRGDRLLSEGMVVREDVTMDWTQYESFDMWTIANARYLKDHFYNDLSLSAGLKNFGSYRCFNVLDRIYGLLGLINAPGGEKLPISVSYSKSPFDLVQECIPFLNTSAPVEGVARLMWTLEVDSSHQEIESLTKERWKQDSYRRSLKPVDSHCAPGIRYGPNDESRNALLIQVPDIAICRVDRTESGELLCNMKRTLGRRTEFDHDLYSQLRRLKDSYDGSVRPRLIAYGKTCYGYVSPVVQDGDYLVAMKWEHNNADEGNFLVVRSLQDTTSVYELVGCGMFAAWDHVHSLQCQLSSDPPEDSSTLTIRFDKTDLIALAAPLTTLAKPTPDRDLVVPMEMYLDRLSMEMTVNNISYAYSSRPLNDLLEDCSCLSQQTSFYII